MRSKIIVYSRDVLKRPLVFGIMVFCMFLLVMMVSRYHATLHLREQTKEAATPVVHIIHAKRSALTEQLVLPGSVMAWHEAPVYARSKGYVKQWYVDIGYHVHKGELLAVVETPELDAQLRQAKANLKVIIAKNILAQITAQRWMRLVKTDSVSKQARDDKVYEAKALAASVVEAQANLDRLFELVSFERVIAPFTGTISLRQTDIGALINIGSDPAQAQPLFKIVQSDRLRLYVNIPETYSAKIKPNMAVELSFAEHPGQRFSARLLKTAKAIDPLTLTLQAEFVVQNKNELLLPGSYTTVEFSLLTSPDSVILPINALIFRAQGLQVGVVLKDDHVVLKPIEIAVDFGAAVQVDSGVKPGSRIVLNPPDALTSGQQVRIVSSTHKGAA